MKKGEAKIEFFSNIEFIKNEYKTGCVVSKFLYNKAKEKRNFKMTYKQFNKYFNDNFLKKEQNITKQTQKVFTPKIKNEPLSIKIQSENKKGIYRYENNIYKIFK